MSPALASETNGCEFTFPVYGRSLNGERAHCLFCQSGRWAWREFTLLWVDVCMTDSVGETGVLMNHNAPCVLGALCLGLDV